MNVKKVVNDLLATGLSTESWVCVKLHDKSLVPIHIKSIEEDINNTGIIILNLGRRLQDNEVGYK